jgi:hypothetical protein
MVGPTQRNRKLITHLPAQSVWLCKPEMVGVAGLPATDHTRLTGYIFQMLLVTPTTRLAQLGRRPVLCIDCSRPSLLRNRGRRRFCCFGLL